MAVECRHTDAGWSSLVARRAHNPKVVGSNPAPATNLTGIGPDCDQQCGADCYVGSTASSAHRSDDGAPEDPGLRAPPSSPLTQQFRLQACRDLADRPIAVAAPSASRLPLLCGLLDGSRRPGITAGQVLAVSVDIGDGRLITQPASSR